MTLPSDEDPRWVLQWYQRPLIAGERMYAAQPGVRTVDCLDVATGRLYWSAVLPEVVGIVGLSGPQLIVRTETEVLALDAATGARVWRHAAAEMHPFALVDDKAVLITLRERVPDSKPEKWQTRLLWLDAATGQPAATSLLANLADADPRLGPLITYKDRVFTFFGKGQHDPTRDVVELIPAAAADKPLPASLATDPWRQRLPAKLSVAAWQVLPDWQLLSGLDGDKTGLAADIHGEKDVLGIRSTAPAPIILGREIALPASGKPRLRVRIAQRCRPALEAGSAPGRAIAQDRRAQGRDPQGPLENRRDRPLARPRQNRLADDPRRKHRRRPRAVAQECGSGILTM